MKYLVGISFIFLLLSCESETIRKESFEMHGIDVSHYQSRINWDTVAAQEIHFAFVKASEGYYYTDSLYCDNWEHMQRVGIKRGAYHFYRPSISAEIQASNFTNMVDLEFGDLPPVLDVEVLDGVSKIKLITGIREWLYAVEIKYSIKPILYTNLKFYNRYLAGHFIDYPIWIARYNTREPRLACGRDWQFWQYGNRGRLKGIEGHVDFNVFNGNGAQLEDLCLAPKAALSSW
ncbi:MAG: hypothetical protein DHS20C18_04760 [Saprospiraceae bacterium]|nr:MAG: hypothetical protein DHS20C18_04760 [Saprospiraceae bacterium]